jgi:hypothetical protein
MRPCVSMSPLPLCESGATHAPITEVPAGPVAIVEDAVSWCTICELHIVDARERAEGERNFQAGKGSGERKATDGLIQGERPYPP